MNKSILFTTLLGVFSAFNTNALSNASPDIHIKLAQPKWVMSESSHILMQREAKLLPQEHSVGQNLRGFLEVKDYAGALQVIEQALANGKLEQLSPALLQLKGQIHLNLQQDEKAAQAFSEALKQLPDFVRAHKNLAIIYLKQQAFDKARQHLVKVISMGEQDPQLFGQLAYINLQQNSPWSAISGYQKALFLQPDNKQWQKGLLFSLIRANNISGAQALLQEMLEQQPEDTELWLQQARINISAQNQKQALTSMEMALRLGNQELENVISTAQLHLNHGSAARAAQLFEQVVRRWQRDVKDKSQQKKYFEALDSAISWFVYKEQYDHARTLLTSTDKNIKGLSSKDKSNLKLHTAHLPNANKQQVTRLFEQAISLDPGNGNALIGLAEHYRNLKNLSQAQLLFVRAQSLSGFAERAYVGHAQVKIDQHQFGEAAKLLRKALKLNPSRHDLVQNISLLDRLHLKQS